MAAELWRGTLLAELGIAAAIAWPLAGAADGEFGVLIALWLAIFLLLQVLLVVTAFALSRATARGTFGPLHARTVVVESAELLRAAIVMSIHSVRGRRQCDSSRINDIPADGSNRPAVLLIHGFVCNGAIWGPLRRRLVAAGFDEIHVMELRPLFADIEVHATKAAQTLLAMQRHREGRRIIVIAHSMGGLVVRAALRAIGPSVVSRIITLGTPHHGTAIACHISSTPTRQMCPGSPWLQRLNAEQEGRFNMPVTTIYSPDDTLIAPARSAELAGARVVRIDGLGHFSLASSARSLERVISELRQESQG